MLSKMSKYIDVIIPRGGKSLVKKVQDLSSVPVIGHLEGMCHTYIDKDANLSTAKKILINAKDIIDSKITEKFSLFFKFEYIFFKKIKLVKPKK